MARKKTTSKRRGKYQLNTMEDLKREADKSATWRGHELKWSIIGRMRGSGFCSKCRAGVFIELRPAGEEHVFSGAALLHTCLHKSDLPARRESE